MQIHGTDSGLGEAFASYQPKSIPASVWDRLRPEAFALVAQLDLDEFSARKALSRLAAFLADLAEVRPDATISDLLTREQVEGHLERAKASGVAPGTLQNRQGTLNGLLRIVHGEPPASPARQPESHLAPHARDELLRLVSAASRDGGRDAIGFARTVLCGLAGHPLPGKGETVEVSVRGHEVLVGEHEFILTDVGEMPGSGQLAYADISRGRRWARELFGFRLDLRRLSLRHLADLVATFGALEVLQLPGAGRDRLTAAVAAAPEVDEATYRGLLRGAAATG